MCAVPATGHHTAAEAAWRVCLCHLRLEDGQLLHGSASSSSSLILACCLSAAYCRHNLRMLLQVRVLAARDPHGSIQLAQARTSDGSLVIASGRFLPEGCHDLTEIDPGYFKYVSSPR